MIRSRSPRRAATADASWRRCGVACIAWACGCALPASFASAQEGRPADPIEQIGDASSAATAAERAAAAGKPQLFVTFPLERRSLPSRWIPVVLSVQGGLSPFDGHVRIEYQHDSSRATAVVTRVAATPGKTSDFTICISPPSRCTGIRFQLEDANGRVQELKYSTSPGKSEMPLPWFDSGSTPDILAVGATTGPAASIGVAMRTDPARRSARMPTIRPEWLPVSWTGYDGMRALVVDADSAASVDPRSMAAVHEWVSGGGRLVVIASSAGSSWRAWLPPAPFGQMVSLDDPAVTTPPADLSGAVAATGSQTAPTVLDQFPGGTPRQIDWTTGLPVFGPLDTTLRPSMGRSGEVVPSEQPSTPDTAAPPDRAAIPESPRIAPTLTARAITLTPFGQATGWQVRWSAAAVSPDEITVRQDASGAGAKGLLAEGPVGYGWVTIAGLDPRRVGAVARDSLTAAVWNSMLGSNFINFVSAPQDRFSYQPNPTDVARRTVLDDLADVPYAGNEAFYIIIAAMLALALLLGPADAFGLKRLSLRHWSWITSLLWIGLACLAAYRLPVMSRSSGSIINRAQVVDVIFPPGTATLLPPTPSAAPLIQTGVGGATPLAWHSSLTGIFAGGSMTTSISGDSVHCSWWRPVSAEAEAWGWGGGERESFVASFLCGHTSPDLASLGSSRPDPWGGWTPGPSCGAGGQAPLDASFSIWTFNTFEDRARGLPPCSVAFEPTTDGVCRVRLSALPAGVKIESAALRVGRTWSELAFGDPIDGATISAPVSASLTPAKGWTLPPGYENAYSIPPQAFGASNKSVLRHCPAAALSLPGTLERTAAINALLATGRWAVVYVHLTRLPGDLSLSSAATSNRQVILRALIPVPEHLPRAAGAVQ